MKVSLERVLRGRKKALSAALTLSFGALWLTAVPPEAAAFTRCNSGDDFATLERKHQELFHSQKRSDSESPRFQLEAALYSSCTAAILRHLVQSSEISEHENRYTAYREALGFLSEQYAREPARVGPILMVLQLNWEAKYGELYRDGQSLDLQRQDSGFFLGLGIGGALALVRTPWRANEYFQLLKMALPVVGAGGGLASMASDKNRTHLFEVAPPMPALVVNFPEIHSLHSQSALDRWVRDLTSFSYAAGVGWATYMGITIRGLGHGINALSTPFKWHGIVLAASSATAYGTDLLADGLLGLNQELTLLKRLRDSIFALRDRDEGEDSVVLVNEFFTAMMTAASFYNHAEIKRKLAFIVNLADVRSPKELTNPSSLIPAGDTHELKFRKGMAVDYISLMDRGAAFLRAQNDDYAELFANIMHHLAASYRKLP